MIRTCKGGAAKAFCGRRWLHGVEPYTYLKDVLERLRRTTNREVDQLMPLKWKQARQSALEQAA